MLVKIRHKPLVVLLLMLIVLSQARGASVSAACSMAADKGTATKSFSVPTAGTYRVWLRMNGPNSSANSVNLQIDEALCNINMGDGGITNNTWTWVDWKDGNTNSKVNVTLSAGQHTLKLAGREASAKIDYVLLVGDASCVPTGTSGSNCSSVATPVSPTSGTGESAQNDGSQNSDGTIVTASGEVVQIAGPNADPEPPVETVADVPAALVSAIANPTSIPRVIKGSYGWAIGTAMLTTFAGIGVGLWLLRPRIGLLVGHFRTTPPWMH